ncbi:hypothetical protein ABPG74_019740 [Tetrahymena malaccensis]
MLQQINVQYQFQVDTFSIGIIILQALLGDSLKPMQIVGLKLNLIENIIPNLKNYPNYDFIQNIVSQMIHYEQQNRLEPLKLIQNLKSYKIEQDCLKQLAFPQKLKQSASLQQQSVVQQSNSQQIDQQIAQLPQYLQIYAQDNFNQNISASNQLFPLFDTLNNQQNLLELGLYLIDMGLKEDTLIYISKMLTKFTFLKKFNLNFAKNYADYGSIKHMIEVLAKNNTSLENIWLYFWEMKSVVFQNLDMILSIFNYFNSMKRLSYLSFHMQLSDFGKAHKIKKPSLQHTNQQLEGNLFYMSPEVEYEKKPYTIKVDTFSIGIIILQALFEDSLEIVDIKKLKTDVIENVIPNLNNNKNYEFIKNILSQMIHHDQNQRLEPLKLIQNLKSFQIEQDCLKQLIFHQKLQQRNSQQQQKIEHHSNSEQINQQIGQLPQQLQIYAQDLHLQQRNQRSNNPQVAQKYQIDQQFYENFKDLIDQKEVDFASQNKKITNEQIEAISAILNECYQLETVKRIMFRNCQLTNEQCLSLFSFLDKERNQNLRNIYINLCGNHLISTSGSLEPLFNTLSKQQNLWDLKLSLQDMMLKEDALTQISKMLAKFKFLKVFFLVYDQNYADYSYIKQMTEVLTKKNISLEKLSLSFSNMKSIVFQSFDMILDVFSYFNSMKQLVEVKLSIKGSYNTRSIKFSQLRSFKNQNASYKTDFSY